MVLKKEAIRWEAQRMGPLGFVCTKIAQNFGELSFSLSSAVHDEMSGSP